MLRLILGQAGSGKTALCFGEIAKAVKKGETGIFFLVPEQYSHEAERELCAAAGDALSLSAEVVSFSSLARRVLSETGCASRIVDKGGRLLCMAAAVTDLRPRLRTYRKPAGDPRFLTNLLRTADEVKNAGITPPQLYEKAGEAEEPLREKLEELALILEAFQAEQLRNGSDAAEALVQLAEKIPDSSCAGGRFYVDGFTDFTVLQRNVLCRLLDCGADLTVCLGCGGAGEQFALPEKTKLWLENCAAERRIPCEMVLMESSATDSIAGLCRDLFDFSASQATMEAKTVKLVSAPGMYEECELVAARMLELVSEGARWRDMAVAARGFSSYRTALESVFERYEIPLFLSGRGDLLRKSLPLALFSALRAASEGYEYDALFSWLKSGLAGLTAEETDVLENYALLWELKGKQWKRPFTGHPDGYGAKETEETTERLRELETYRTRIMPPLEALEKDLKQSYTALDFARAAAEFLRRTELNERAQNRAEDLRSAGDDARASEYDLLWELLCVSLEQFADTLGERGMEIGEFLMLWSAMLNCYDISVIPASLNRVQAGEMNKMRRRHIKHLFVLGVTDENLPSPPADDSLLSATDREEMRSLGLQLGADMDYAEEQLSREFSTIYNCLSLPSESLTLLRPEMNSSGETTRPSLVAERASALLGCRWEKGNLSAARLRAREPAFALAARAAAGSDCPEALAAYDWYTGQNRGEDLRRLAALKINSRDSLSEQAVQGLYGSVPALTPSRAESLSNCHFAYFLRYGLKAEPRIEQSFQPRDFGNFMHYVLEKLVLNVMREGGFHQVSRSRAMELAGSFMDDYIDTKMGRLEEQSARFVWLFRRLRTTVEELAGDLWDELSVSAFEPMAVELDVGRALLPEEEQGSTRLYGRVDRVDGWNKDGVLYIRVVDYKTGKKTFAIEEVCRGRDMQMLLYLFALKGNRGGWFEAKEIRPAGVLYARERREIKKMDEFPSEEELMALRTVPARNGLLLDDPDVIEAMEPGDKKVFLPARGKTAATEGKNYAGPERMGALESYVNQKIERLTSELCSGNVAANPWYKSGQENACALCDYREACMFDEWIDCLRPVEKLNAAQAWEKIENGEV